MRSRQADTATGEQSAPAPDIFNVTLARLLATLQREDHAGQRRPLPSWGETTGLLEDLHVLQLAAQRPADTEKFLTRAMHTLEAQLRISTQNDDVAGLVNDFLLELPSVQQTLHEDTQATFRGDPAAVSSAEIVLCYPGLRALAIYRVAHVLYRLGVPLLPRLMTEIAHSLTGIDIHPGADIGKRLLIDHGTGVVVGETCVIGDDVRIYQGVTLGARSFQEAEDGQLIKGHERHPVIGDGVTIYAGATILGRVTIGAGSVIGGNVWVTNDVPPGTRLVQRRPR